MDGGISEFISKINPNDLPGTVILLLLMFGAWRFLNKSLWPFVTDKWWPAQVTRAEQSLQAEREQTTVLQSLRDAVVALKEMTAQLSAAFTLHNSEVRESLSAVHDRLLLLTGKPSEASK